MKGLEGPWGLYPEHKAVLSRIEIKALRSEKNVKLGVKFKNGTTKPGHSLRAQRTLEEMLACPRQRNKQTIKCGQAMILGHIGVEGAGSSPHSTQL